MKEETLVRLDTEKLKKVQLEILDTVASFCDEYGIRYWLDFGTLIGAIRHEGYIPWDDDIDISMLRVDFDKFMKLFNEKNDRYKFCCYELNKSFPFAFGKVLDTETVLYEPDRNGQKLSVNIDVFVYDNAPADPKKTAAMYRRRDRYNLLDVAKKHHGKAKGNFLRRFAAFGLKCFARLFPKNYFVKRIVRYGKKYAGVSTGYVGDFLGNLTYFHLERSYFNEFIKGDFEGRKYSIPKNYDVLLRSIYGDYMQLPPEAQRVSHHKFEAYFKSTREDEDER